MTTPTPLPLDAVALAARVAELERELNGVREASATELRTAYKRVAELECERDGYRNGQAQVQELFDGLWKSNTALVVHANALRDALAEWDSAYRAANFGTTEGCGRLALAMEAARTALAAHPAASLAAHDAEVIERAKERVTEALREYHTALMDNSMPDIAVGVAESKVRAIRALAAQAQEVTK